VSTSTPTPAWFCVQTKPKHEHIAAGHLRQEGIEVFLPRLRFRKNTVRGPAWFTEALFPSYLFARFDWQRSLRLVTHAHGVSRVVSFGGAAPQVPEATIAELRQSIGADELRVLPHEVQPGQRVVVAEGAFLGLEAVVAQVMPSRERVQVLLDFLGRQTMVEIRLAAVLPEEPPRARI
jgi:transcriptional antiterminator RfaH